MPLIKFFGIPRYTSEEYCSDFKEAVREAVVAIPQMNLTMNDVSVKLMAEVGGFDGEIHIEITFNDKEERTLEVRNQLAKVLAEITLKHFLNVTHLVECWGEPFNSDRGFFCLKKGE